jgi:hypothetical protein
MRVIIKMYFWVVLAFFVPSVFATSLPQLDDQRCKTMSNMPNDGPEAITFYKNQVVSNFWQAEVSLERDVNDWNTPTCIFDDGRPRLKAFGDGLTLAFSSEKDWSKGRARLDVLKSKLPKSPIIALAEAEYWTSYAWNARGGGYASSVTPDGWKLFRERLEIAENILLNSKPYTQGLPTWYESMVTVQNALGRSEEERISTFQEGAKKFKTYYPMYFASIPFFTPKWGGSWEKVDSFIKWSVENTKTIDGNTMYARLYWSASGTVPKGTNIFKVSLAEWPQMKKGFEDLMARHPKSKWNLNNFARFACQAEDKDTFLKLRKQISKDINEKAWEAPPYELCDEKYGYLD